jgi:DHA1 family bicyclomycin/chloramphenicol resistance-like MFS transporter
MKKAVHPLLLIVVVALIGMLAPFSIDTYLPSFRAIEQELVISRALLLQTLSVYLFAFALATLVWGPLVDKWGRRPIILVSLFGYLAASILIALANSFETLFVGRAMQGLMVAGGTVASRAMIRDYFDGAEAQKAMALMMMLFVIAPAIAPIIGGWLEVHFGWRSVFYFLAAYALVIVALFYTRISETQNAEHKQSIHPLKLAGSYWHTLTHPHFVRLVAAQGLLTGGFFVYVAGSASLIFDHLQMEEQDFWRFFVPVVAGIFVGSMIIHRLSHRFKPRALINSALVLAAIGVMLNLVVEQWLAVTAFWVVAPIVLYALGYSMTNPGLSVLAFDCLPTKRGLASSLQAFMQMGMAALVTALVVPLVEQNLLHMALANAALFSLAVVLWLSVRRGLRRADADVCNDQAC